MNDTIKAVGGTLLRHWLLLLLGAGLSHNIVPKEVVDAVNNMTGLEVLSFAGAIGVMGWGAYTRLKGKTKQKLALKLPAGTTEAHLRKVANKQPLSAILKTEPTVTHLLLIALLPCFLLVSCASDMTPEQAQQWAWVGHTVLRNGLQDAKDFEAVTR